MNEAYAPLKERQILLPALIGIVLILYGTSSRPIELLAILFCILVVVFSEDDLLTICCLACWMNVAQVFKLSVDGTSIYTALVLLFAVKKLVQFKKIEKNFLVLLLIYAIYLVIGMRSQFFIVIKIIMMPLQLYVMAMSLDYKGLKRVSGYFILGIIIESTASLYNGLIPGLIDYIPDGNAYSVATIEGYVPELRFSGLWDDPNYYAIHLIIGILICVILFSRKEISAFSFLVVVSILTYFGARTLSKSFILMFAVIMLYAYLLFLNNKQYWKVALMTLVLLILIALIAGGVIDTFSLILERLTEGLETGEGLTTGRTEIWLDYINYYYRHPMTLLFGEGLGGYLPFEWAPHNAYLEIVFYIGITGTFIFCLTIYNAVVSAWDLPLKGTAAPFLFTIVMYFFLGMYYSLDLQFELLLILGYLWMNKGEEMSSSVSYAGGDIIGDYEINSDC